MQATINLYAPLSGDPFSVTVDAEAFARMMEKYRTLYPSDTRAFEDMSSDIQHAIIRAALAEAHQ